MSFHIRMLQFYLCWVGRPEWDLLKNFMGFFLSILKLLRKLHTFAFFSYIWPLLCIICCQFFLNRMPVFHNENFNSFLIRLHMFSQKLSLVFKLYIFWGWITEIENFNVVRLSVLPLRFLAVSISWTVFFVPRSETVVDTHLST